jgi:hypothetical protein
MSADENGIRADLEKAFEQHTAEPTQETRGPEQDAPESVRDPAQRQESEARAESPAEAGNQGDEGGNSDLGRSDGRDEQGRFKPKDGTKPEGTQPAQAQSDKKPEENPQQVQQQESLTPPAGWKAGAREHWAKIPRAAQEEIHRREKETAQTLRQSSQARQLANDFQQVVNPFMQFIQAQNSTPLAAVKNLMTTAAGLTVGTSVQKAQIIRDIIQNYGVDINTLDQVLSGQPVQQGNVQQQQQMAPPQWAQPIFQFMQGVQQTRQQREQQIIADAEAETEAFAAKNEFFEDVREEMADRMEVAAKHGRVMTMQQAYDVCVRDNPELSKIVTQRQAAQKAQQTNIQRNRNAASSIAGAPRNGPTGAKGGGDSRRAALEEAWDEQMNR